MREGLRRGFPTEPSRRLRCLAVQRHLALIAALPLIACAAPVAVDDDSGTPPVDASVPEIAPRDTGTADTGGDMDAGADASPPPMDASLPDVGAGVAVLQINEVNPNVTGSLDLVELRVVTAGSTAGITLEQDITSAVVLATLPAINVAQGDLIVVHLTPPSGVTNETSSKTSCANAACYPGAYDVRGAAVGITYSGRVLVVRAPNTTIEDGVSFYRQGSTSPGSFPGELMALQAAGHWLPANCGGPCNTVMLAEGVSADWNGCGTTETGASAYRKGNADTNTKNDWAVGTQSFGAPNP